MPAKQGPRTLSALALILLWLSLLTKSDALYIGYLVPGIAAAAGAVYLRGRTVLSGIGRGGKCAVCAAVFLYAAAVTAANTDIVRQILAPRDYFAVRKVYAGAAVLVLLAGSAAVALQILRLLLHLIETQKKTAPAEKRERGGAVFAVSFLVIFAVYAVYLLGCAYPGNLTTDSISQVSQILSGHYSDQHPYWHTVFMGLFIRAGYAATGSLAAGIACFALVQAAVMAAIFACAVTTLYRLGAPKAAVWGSFLLYLLLPYHVLYSATLWKDVLFGGAALLLVTVLLRLADGGACAGRDADLGTAPADSGHDSDRFRRDIILLALAGAMLCLFRSNGWLVFLATTACYAFFEWRSLRAVRRPLAVMTGVLCVTFLLNHPALDLLRVEHADILEACGVPLQQVAGFLADEGTDALDADEYAMLERLAPPELMRDVYEPELVDPVKAVIRQQGGLSELDAYRGDYLRLYFRLLKKHPGGFLRAYVRHTRSFYNAGYANYIWAQGIGGNSFGVESAPGNHFLTAVKNSYLWLFENSPTLQIIKCIGLWVFALIFLFATAVAGNRRRAILAVPGIAVVLTLLLATPAGNEFRYVYAVMTTLPVAAAGICLCTDNGCAERDNAEKTDTDEDDPDNKNQETE